MWLVYSKKRNVLRLQEIPALRRAFSEERLTKYKAAYCGPADASGDYCGYGLYIWNSKLAAACFTSIHVMEVVLRNAIAEACEAKYGANWMYLPSFHTSLKQGSYDELYDLTDGFSTSLPIGKLIPELTFFFWQGLLATKQYDRLWKGRLFHIFPSATRLPHEKDSLKKLHDAVEHVRLFRNRIAHHEPIFNRNIGSDMNFVNTVVKARSHFVSGWLAEFDEVPTILASKP